MVGCAAVSIVAVIAFAGQAVRADDEPQENRSGKSVALDRKMADELRGCATAVSNPIIQGFVEAIGRRLAAQLPKRDSTFTLNVIAQDLFVEDHGAIALPGGYLFLPAALFQAAADEEEFAGMVAQGMAQSNVIEEELSRLGVRSYVMTDILQSLLCTFRVPANYLKEQRTIERRADTAAISLMARAGFNPNGLVSYVQRVQARRSSFAGSFSTLPPVKERVAAMRAEIAKLPAGAYASAEAGRFEEAKDEVRRMEVATGRSDAPSLHRK